jgi:aspartyl-tRNA(Asn)/glutamyl-tRNA(Gln) amidotransferase subunit B
MPVMNGEAIRLTVMTGLMLGCRISEYSKFDRKSYFYPDMPKNYQISQYDKPLCEGGHVDIEVEGKPGTVAITRIHLEEDVAKNMHFAHASGIDFNRAGIPLMEIVTEPDIASPAEAFAFLSTLKAMLQYGEISDCNLEEGNIRCDVNISVRPAGRTQLGTKAELKNLNTFRGVQNSLAYEIDRQVEIVNSGGTIRQETRRWDADTGTTSSMRTKEDAHDYRYFAEPDLMPVVLSAEQIETWRALLPELPRQRRDRFIEAYGLPEYDAGVLVADKDVADYFEDIVQLEVDAKAASNWVMTEVLRRLSETEESISDLLVTPAEMAGLIKLVTSKTINIPTAKDLLLELFEKGGDPASLVREKGLTQVSDSSAIEALVDRAMTEHPQSVEDYRKGKTAAAKFLVGQVMRLSKGKADPHAVHAVLEERLGNAS